MKAMARKIDLEALCHEKGLRITEQRRVIAQVLGIRHANATANTTVYDPTCGSGSLLLKAADEAKAGQFVAQDSKVKANVFSQPPSSNKNEIGSMRVLGRSLFSDYLYFVELAGTVLLIATIGAIAIAPRRSQGTL